MQLKLTSEHSISQVVIRLLHESSTTRDSTSTLSQLLTLRCYCTALETSSSPQEQAVSWERAPAGCRAASPEHYSFALQSQQPPSVCFESFSTQVRAQPTLNPGKFFKLLCVPHTRFQLFITGNQCELLTIQEHLNNTGHQSCSTSCSEEGIKQQPFLIAVCSLESQKGKQAQLCNFFKGKELNCLQPASSQFLHPKQGTSSHKW